jgi:major membrane immunogen (membrane-anchored lipoprotein)
MKKVLLIVSLIALSLSACTKKDPTNEFEVKNETYRIVDNEFEYNATDGIKVLVSEFVNELGSEWSV